MLLAQTYTVTFVPIDCGACGVPFGMTETFYNDRLNDHKAWYCPNGHSRVYSGQSDADKALKRAETAEQRLKWALAREEAQRRERAAAERSAAAYRGHLTRLRNRISNGVCPVQGCRRHFSNVHAHISSEHPQWAAEHPGVLTD